MCLDFTEIEFLFTYELVNKVTIFRYSQTSFKQTNHFLPFSVIGIRNFVFVFEFI